MPNPIAMAFRCTGLEPSVTTSAKLARRCGSPPDDDIDEVPYSCGFSNNVCTGSDPVRCNEPAPLVLDAGVMRCWWPEPSNSKVEFPLEIGGREGAFAFG